MKSLIHQKINIKSEVLLNSSRKGDLLPYSGVNKHNYAVDVSYYGTVSKVGTDPEDVTIRRDYLAEFSELIFENNS